MKYDRRLPPHIDVDDLVSAGVAGFLSAIDKYDPKKNDSFVNFVNYHIRWGVLDELRRWDHLTRRQRQMVRKIETAYFDLEYRLGREPSDVEIAETIHIPMDIYNRHRALSHLVFLSFEDQWQGDSGADILDLIFHKQVEIPLIRSLERLPERERRIVEQYYLKERPLKDVAEELGISISRASQLRKQAVSRLDRIRQKLEAVA